MSPGRGMSLLRIKDGKSAAQLVCALISSRRRTVAPAERSEREREGEDLEAGRGRACGPDRCSTRGGHTRGPRSGKQKQTHSSWRMVPLTCAAREKQGEENIP